MRILEIGNKIAVGGTSEIYEYGDKIVKLYFNKYTEDDVKYEYEKTLSAFSAGIPVPKIYEMIEINGRHGLVFERIQGITLNEKLYQNCTSKIKDDIVDEKILEEAYESIKVTARVLADVHKVKATLKYTVENALLYFTENNNYLTGYEKEQVIKIIYTLPKGESVCHGDPNPNNILFTGEIPI